ncbi:MAG: hypothetical protein ABR543_14630 [Gemmatimonadaceae bacterium]
MKPSAFVAALGVALACASGRAGAQVVGYPPSASPFRDLSHRHQLSAFTGYYLGSEGDAGVAPGPGAALGVRYEIRIGGPAQFLARLTGVMSERTVKDPSKSNAERDLGKRSWPVYIADVGLSFNLTGQKSFHRMVPVLNAGVGVASDLGKGPDVGGFKLGTPFAFSFGTGVRWSSGGRFEVRADVADYIYQLSYPESYRTAPAGEGNTPLLGSGASADEWTHNPVLSIGVSYLFGR